ncbi:sialin-like [Argiope bruennichi]|uniref:sialin-like n=1 Tax=Argiope bruennichi TaxID=94029 RepID=UPI0024956AEB|nr:sialin-like [Argiope bruennichi]
MVYTSWNRISNLNFRCWSTPKSPNAFFYYGLGIKYNWDPKTQGIILSSFYYGYVVTQLPGGILCDRFGAKWLFGGGVLVTTFLYLLIPLAANWSVLAFTIIRILEGLGEGLAFPAITHAISNWAPRFERSRISSVICMGVPIGNIIGSPISGFLSSTDFIGGWPSIFYLFGSFGCAWFLLWCILVYETPEDHPRISKEELLYIQQNKDEKLQTKAPIPWKKIFSSLPVWAVIIAHFGQNYAFLMFLTLMPTYFKTILHFDIKTNGVLSAMPYAALAISMALASYLADRLRKWNKMSISTIRKTANSIGLVGPALCCIGIVASSCQRELIVGLLCLAMFLNGFAFSGFNVTHVDMSADFSGVLYGITNTVANTAGILSPTIVGFLTASGETVENWNTVFCITCAVYMMCALFYAFFASAEVQPWGLAKRDTPAVSKSEKPLFVEANNS